MIRGACLLSLVAVVGLPARAAANPDAAACKAKDAESYGLLQRSKFKPALEASEKAISLCGVSAKLELRAATALRNMGRGPDALARAQSAYELAHASGDSGRRAAALIRDLQNSLALVRVLGEASMPPGTLVLLDGVMLDALPASRRVNPGDHVVEIVSTDGSRTTRKFRAKAGTGTTDVRVGGRRKKDAGTGATAPVLNITQIATSQPVIVADRSPRPAGGMAKQGVVLLFGLGSAVGVGLGVSYLLEGNSHEADREAISKDLSSDSACSGPDPEPECPALQEAVRQRDDADRSAIRAFSVGALSLGMGVLTWVLWPDEDTRVTAGVGWLSVRRRF